MVSSTLSTKFLWPVPVNVLLQSQSDSWFAQNLSNMFFNVLILFAVITEAGKLLHIFTILTENE